MPAVIDHTLGDCFLTEIKGKKGDWEAVVKEALKEGKEGWEEHDRFLTRFRAVYVPADEKLRHRVIQAHHDDHVSGHPSQFRTAELITRNYYWPSLLQDAKRYVPDVKEPNCSRRNYGVPHNPMQCRSRFGRMCRLI
jgi:hypothetical protein